MSRASDCGIVNVAVIAPGGLTPALRALPVVAGLATGHRVVLMAGGNASALAGALPGVEVVAVPGLSVGGRRLSAVTALRRRRLDAVVLCSDRAADRALAYASGCARRVGPGGGAGAALLTDTVPPEPGPLAAGWLSAAGRLGATTVPAPWLTPGEAAQRRAEAETLGGGLEGGRPLVAVDPGSPRTATGARWDPERLAHLGNLLSRRHDVGVVVLGDRSARGLADRLLLDLEAPVRDLSGELDLLETAAVLARCDLLIAPDGHRLHLAAAVGTSTLGLFGPGDGRRLMPLGARHRALQAIDAGGPATLARVRVEDALAVLEAPPAA